jgi:hypothetical protein
MRSVRIVIPSTSSSISKRIALDCGFFGREFSILLPTSRRVIPGAMKPSGDIVTLKKEGWSEAGIAESFDRRRQTDAALETGALSRKREVSDPGAHGRIHCL